MTDLKQRVEAILKINAEYCDSSTLIRDIQEIIQGLTEREAKLVDLLKDADIWVPEMREALNSDDPSWFFLDARMENLEAWHKDIKRTLKKLGIEQ